MKERPILFSGPMVRAILGERKSQTRRVLKDPNGYAPEHPMSIHQMPYVYPAADSGFVFWDSQHPEGLAEFTKEQYKNGLRCPYGAPGESLWVRETWRTSKQYDDTKPSEIPPDSSLWYIADHYSVRYLGKRPGKTRPSIFMPRWASRITLEVTGVRVEQVQSITEEDATAEGMCYAAGGCCEWCNGSRYNHTWPSGCPHCGATGHTHRYHFQQLWDRLNAKRGYSWEVNPWVWVVEFRRLEASHG
jgi:hypothetical protein